ncbi:MAG: hypothetical protein U0469_01720 [Candidatus Paceibacterota bacterium]|jgi:hypothetical protein
MKKLLFFLTVFLLSGIFATKNYSQSKANTKKADYQDPKNWGPGWNNTNGGCKVCDSVKNFSLPTFIYQNIRYPIVDSLAYKKYGSEKYAGSFYSSIVVDSSERSLFSNFLYQEQKVVSYDILKNGIFYKEAKQDYKQPEANWKSWTVCSIFIIFFLLAYSFKYVKHEAFNIFEVKKTKPENMTELEKEIDSDVMEKKKEFQYFSRFHLILPFLSFGFIHFISMVLNCKGYGNHLNLIPYTLSYFASSFVLSFLFSSLFFSRKIVDVFFAIPIDLWIATIAAFFAGIYFGEINITTMLIVLILMLFLPDFIDGFVSGAKRNLKLKKLDV